jgi:hypothetical protein
LNDTGATVFAVTLSKDYYLPELEIYAGSKDRVYTDDKANSFLADIGKLTNGDCPAQAVTQTTNTVSNTTPQQPPVVLASLDCSHGKMDLEIVFDSSASIEKASSAILWLQITI